MRGIYAAAYLERLAASFALRRGVAGLDVGQAFDLLVGTSTGGIIACALAAGLPLLQVVELYRKHGAAIFPRKMPTSPGTHLFLDLLRRPRSLRAGAAALHAALQANFGGLTMGKVYEQRGIAIAIPAVELSQHRGWVFKTPHLATTNHRDDGYALVDVCMATTSAPLFRSIASLRHPDHGPEGVRAFVDGGLWANNPVLVGLIEALSMAEPNSRIEVFALGTCGAPPGEAQPSDLNRGLPGWAFGAKVAALSIDAQQSAYDVMTRLLLPHLNRPCEVERFPSQPVRPGLSCYLDLDETRPSALDELINQARTDADYSNSASAPDATRQRIAALFNEAPVSNEATFPHARDETATG